MDIDILIEGYIKSEEINPKRHTRLKSRKYFFNRFKEYLADRDVTEVGIKEALGYQGWLLEFKLRSKTTKDHITAISSFYNYMEKENIVYSNPFNYITRLKVEKRIPRNILDEKNMNYLLESLRDWNSNRHLKERKSLYKAHVIAELMYSTGLRSFEVANLKIDDIDLSNGVVTVREGKGGFPRKAILNGYIIDILETYINRMRELTFTENNIKNGDILFGLKEDSFNKFINKQLEESCSKLELTKITSHGFRHALGYHLLRSGCGIKHIQDILGHKNVKSTEIYTKVDKKDLKKVLNRYHPRILKRISNEVNNK